jgi:hypothetical protein
MRTEEAMMRLGAALVCVAVLYSVDALMFHGWYADAVTRVIAELYAHG